MSETKTKKRKRVPENSILKRMEDSDPEMREAFEAWVAFVWNVAPGPALDLGVTRPFDVPPQRWKIADFEITWTQILDVCRSDQKNVETIVGEIFEDFTAEAVRKAKLFFHAEIANANREWMESALATPVEMDVDDSTWGRLYNAGLSNLDMQRMHGTVEDQAEAVMQSVARADYVVVIAFLREAPYWSTAWVRGQELAIKRGHEACPPIEATHVLYVPSLDMLDVVLTAYGDCPAAVRLRDDLCRDDGQDFLGQCRHLATVDSMTRFYGPQPTSPTHRR
jgi:hypothetical protein